MKTFTTDQLLKRLQGLSDSGYGDQPVHISVPFRDGIGFQYIDVVNVTVHEGITDIFTTKLTCDDKERG